MADHPSRTPISLADYETIEAAVMETERGRWFLKEFARRNRTADTQMLLDAIDRIERVVSVERWISEMDRLRTGLVDMANAVAETKAGIAAGPFGAAAPGSDPLEAVSRTAVRAGSTLHATAERIQESALAFRDDGADPALCDTLELQAARVSTAATLQDLTAQRVAGIIETLRYLETRIRAMITIWGEDETAPAPDDLCPAPEAEIFREAGLQLAALTEASRPRLLT
jgi:hypothetical protein